MRLGRVTVWLCVSFYGAIAGVAPFAMAQPAATQATNWGLPQLMHELAQVESASARFTEQKTMHMLNAPLVTSGTLDYVAPDYVRKITVSPEPERFVLAGNRVTIAGGSDHRTHIFNLTDDPQIAGLIEGIRATLAGDLPALDRSYAVQFTGDVTQWQLLLRPKAAGLAHFVRRIRIRGSQDRIEAIDTESGDGDHSEMSIVENVIDAR